MFDFDVVTGSAGQCPSDKGEKERRPKPDEPLRSDTIRRQGGSPFLSSLPGLTHGCPAHFLRYHVYALDSKENGWMKWQSGSVFEVNCA